MSDRIPYGAPADFQPQSIAGGMAPLGDIFAASADDMRLVENTNAAGTALDDAYAARSAAIKQVTGIDLGNPLVAKYDDPLAQKRLDARLIVTPGETANATSLIAQQRAAYGVQLQALAKQFPQYAATIAADTPIEKDAEAMAKTSDEKLSTLMASHPGWDGFAANLAGSMAGSTRDPLVVGSLFAGGGAGGARTIAGRIATSFFREALINGATTAAAQPFVQDWRARAGLSAGWDQAAQNVLFAAGFGGAVGGTMGGASELIEHVVGRANPNLTPKARAALNGDGAAAASMLSEIRDTLPAEARGAIDAAETQQVLDAVRPDGVTQARHDWLVQRAALAANANELPPTIINNDVEVNRVVQALAPAPDSISTKAGALGPRSDEAIGRTVDEIVGGGTASRQVTRPVLQLVKQLGGVHPEGKVADELRSAGLSSRNAPGLFSRQGRRDFDNIPRDELPAELQHVLPDDGNGYASEQGIIAALDAEAKAAPARDRIGGEDFQSIAEQRDYLERQGVDFSAPREDVIAQVRAVEDAERRFAAAEPNDMGLSTEETMFLPPGLTRRLHTEQLVRQALDLQPGLPANLIRDAVNLSMFEQVPIGEAVDWAMGDAAKVPRQLPPSEFAELGDAPPAVEETPNLPAERSEGDGEDAIDFKALEEAGFGSEAKIPFGDEMVSMEELQARLEKTAWLENVVAACKA